MHGIVTLILILLNAINGFNSTTAQTFQSTIPVVFKETNFMDASTENRIINLLSRNYTQDIRESAGIESLRDHRQLPASIEVKVGSTLAVEPGTPGKILFEITNNRPIMTDFYFNIHDNFNYIRRFYPPGARVSTGSTVLVKVDLLADKREGIRQGANPDIITLTAEWRTPSGKIESVTKQVYFYLENQQYDATKPYIYYEYAGDCSGSVTPQNCHAKTWRTDITVQDATSGLLSFRSDPVGLTLRKEFIVGTREQILGYYTASCCNTKVDITAIDVLGNSNSITIDIEKKWLSTGEISAVVLGSILLLILIILIIIGIVICVRKNRRTLNIYPNHRMPE